MSCSPYTIENICELSGNSIPMKINYFYDDKISQIDLTGGTVTLEIQSLMDGSAPIASTITSGIKANSVSYIIDTSKLKGTYTQTVKVTTSLGSSFTDRGVLKIYGN